MNPSNSSDLKYRTRDVHYILRMGKTNSQKSCNVDNYYTDESLIELVLMAGI